MIEHEPEQLPEHLQTTLEQLLHQIEHVRQVIAECRQTRAATSQRSSP